MISVFGDFDPEEMLGLMKTYFNELPQGQKSVFEASTITLGDSEDVILDKEQAALVIAFPTKGIADEGITALELIDAYAGDMSGPLFTRIREELGLAYSVGCSLFHGADAGMLCFYLATSPQQLELAQEELIKEAEKLCKDGIPESVFAATQASQIARRELANQSNRARAQLSTIDVLLGYSAEKHRLEADLVMAETPKSVCDVAAKLFAQKPTIVRVSPEF